MIATPEIKQLSDIALGLDRIAVELKFIGTALIIWLPCYAILFLVRLRQKK